MLIKCPTCGKEMSDEAKTCPNCGAPNKEYEDKKKGSCIYILFALVIIFVIALVLWDVGISVSPQVQIEGTIEQQ